MKSNIEQLIIDNKKEKSRKECSKILTIWHLSFYIIISFCFLILYLKLKIKNEIIKEYQQKASVFELNNTIKIIENQAEEMQIQSKLLDSSKRIEHNLKSALDKNLKKAKEANTTLLNNIESLKRYRKLSPQLLSYDDFNKAENLTNCIFVSDCYIMTRDGFSAKAFHDRCDGLKPTLTLIQAINDIMIGGFTRASWEGNELKYDKDAFLFSLKFNDVYFIIENRPAINASPDLLPTFGRDDLFVSEKKTYYQSVLNSFSTSKNNTIPNEEFDTKLDFFVKEIKVFHLNCDNDKEK